MIVNIRSIADISCISVQERLNKRTDPVVYCILILPLTEVTDRKANKYISTFHFILHAWGRKNSNYQYQSQSNLSGNLTHKYLFSGQTRY